MTTMTKDVTDGIESVITGVGDQSNAALDSVHKFVDAVNATIPAVGADDLRTQVIESAFSMTRQVLDASNRFAAGMVSGTGRTIEGLTDSGVVPKG